MIIMIDDKLMDPRHCLAALFIIYDMYRNETEGVHPFIPSLVSMLQVLQGQESEACLHQRNLLCLLLASQTTAKDLPRKSPAELAAMWKLGLEAPQLPDVVRMILVTK